MGRKVSGVPPRCDVANREVIAAANPGVHTNAAAAGLDANFALVRLPIGQLGPLQQMGWAQTGTKLAQWHSNN